MATTTPNFGWSVPTSTDLVKNGATAIETLGDSIDASFVGLKGGTTGQVLSKTSATDLAYTWTTPQVGDITGVTAGTGISGGGTSGTVTVTNSMATAIDAKGDLIGGTGADTFSRLAVGANDTVLTADSTTATGLKWATVSGGGYTSLASGSLTGTQIDLTSIAGTYRDLVLVWRNVSWSSADRFRFICNNDSTSIYSWIETRNTTVSAASSTMNNNTGQVYSDGLDATGGGSACIITFFDYANTTADKQFQMQYKAQHSSPLEDRLGLMTGVFDSTGAITQINLQRSTSWTSGTYELFGVK